MRCVYRSAFVSPFRAQVNFAVQVDFTCAPSELKHIEGKIVGGSQSVFLHVHSQVNRVSTAANR